MTVDTSDAQVPGRRSKLVNQKEKKINDRDNKENQSRPGKYPLTVSKVNGKGLKGGRVASTCLNCSSWNVISMPRREVPPYLCTVRATYILRSEFLVRCTRTEHPDDCAQDGPERSVDRSLVPSSPLRAPTTVRAKN